MEGNLTMQRLRAVCVFLTSLVIHCNGACYFSPEFQGDYVMQSTVSARSFNPSAVPEVQYSMVNITENAIPVWGSCHKRIGNNVILVSNSGGLICFRCFNLKLRSQNVLQVLTAGKEYLYKCDTNEETAIATCPSESLHRPKHSEIILFKTQDYMGAFIKKSYCPVDGKYSFTYNVNDGSENKMECSGTASNLNSCPSGSNLNLNFRRCSFENYEMEFECLGHWDGPGDQKYLALLGRQRSESQKPHYRCALYSKEPHTGIIHMALSNDSTCTSGLFNSTHGFEALTLTPIKEKEWPQQVYYSPCKFPEWMKGSWEHLTVDENTLIYKDHNSFKTYTMKCVGTVGISASEDKYLIFARTQCDEQMYNCMWIKKRSTNVLEFELGNDFNSTYNIDLCAESNFKDATYITQGRLSKSEESPCPIAGVYTGLIPDTTGLCAKLSSNCKSPEIMNYRVSDCIQNEVFEEREYSCLGQWQENGLVYTYTQRQDVAAGTYECFVGFIISEKEIFIKEAGDHCQRDINPLKYGMKLSKQVSCFDVEISSQPVTYPVTQLTTKPWIPVSTVAPSQNNESAGVIIVVNELCFVLIVLSIFNY